MNRQRVITTLILALILAVPASANDHRRPGDRYDSGRDRHEVARVRGRVIHVQPIWPQVQCRPAAHSGSSSRNGARITGALVGGTLGHLVGREHDQALLGTLAGVVIGASGAEVIVRSQQRADPRRCVRGSDLKYHRSPIAYQVRYRYRGQIYTTRTRTHPGRYIELNPGQHRRG